MNATDTLSRISTSASSEPRSLAGSFSSASVSLLQATNRLLQLWQARLYNRAQLRNMPEYLLRDVGIDFADAQREADKPFWRP